MRTDISMESHLLNLISYGEVEACRPHGQSVVLENDAELEGGHDELDRCDEVKKEAEGERGALSGIGGEPLQAIGDPVGEDDHR